MQRFRSLSLAALLIGVGAALGIAAFAYNQSGAAEDPLATPTATPIQEVTVRAEVPLYARAALKDSRLNELNCEVRSFSIENYQRMMTYYRETLPAQGWVLVDEDTNSVAPSLTYVRGPTEAWITRSFISECQ